MTGSKTNIDEFRESLAKADKFISGNMPELLDFSEELFGATICMIMEEYCKAKEISMLEFSQKMLSAIINVNEALGRY